MPNQVDLAVIKKPQPGVFIISGLLVVGGLAVIMLGMKKGEGGYGDMRKISTTEWMSWPISPTLESGTITAKIGTPINLMTPTVMYQGAGRNTYTYAKIVQTIGGQEVSVYGSGVAGVFVGPASQPTIFELVAADQPQPPGCGCTTKALCAYRYGDQMCLPIGWICGAPPMPGPATVILEIHQNSQQSGRPQDADGFSSPTCGSAAVPSPRVPIVSKRYVNKINFTA